MSGTHTVIRPVVRTHSGNAVVWCKLTRGTHLHVLSEIWEEPKVDGEFESGTVRTLCGSISHGEVRGRFTFIKHPRCKRCETTLASYDG